MRHVKDHQLQHPSSARCLTRCHVGSHRPSSQVLRTVLVDRTVVCFVAVSTLRKHCWISCCVTTFRRLHSARVGQLLKKCILRRDWHSFSCTHRGQDLSRSAFHPAAIFSFAQVLSLSNQFPYGVFEYPHGELLTQRFFLKTNCASHDSSTRLQPIS